MATLPTLSGTGTPAPGALPDTEKSPLLSFADSLDAAVNLARTKRNKSSLDMMRPFQGTVAASDFNSILGNLNAASDKTSGNLIKRATDIGTDILSVSEAQALRLPYGTTKAEAASRGIIPEKSVSDILTRSGALEYSKDDYSDDASQLEQSRGIDGWVDPTIYQKLYDAWIGGGGKIADFVKTFPPEQYVNPENDWLPVYLRPKSSGIVNPFAQ